MQVRMSRKARSRGKQQRVIVARGEKRRDGDYAVSTGTIFHHDGLAPARRQPVGKQPGADVDPASRSQRQNEFDRTLRPSLRFRDSRKAGEHRQHQRETKSR